MKKPICDIVKGKNTMIKTDKGETTMKKAMTVVLAAAVMGTTAQAGEEYGVIDTVKKLANSRPVKVASSCMGGDDAFDCARNVVVDGVVESAAVPTAVAIASHVGAAATSATLAGVGSVVLEGAAVVGITVTAAPAVVGGAVVMAIGVAVAYGINCLFD